MEDLAFAISSGLLKLLNPEVFLFMMIGILVGMFIGLVPGLSGLTGLALLLPFAYTQPPEIAFAFLLGAFAVTTQTDAIPAVLIGVPGTAAAQATVLDGYPMSRRGEAGRALSASYFASIFGTLVAGIVFTLFLPVIRYLIDDFAAPEYFMMAMLGLVMAGSLSGTSVARGLAAAGLGLMIAMVGFAPNTGFPRYDFFQWSYLWDGVPIVPVVLGLFAVPEVVDLLVRRRSISDRPSEAKGALSGIVDTVREFWLIVRCSTIGTVCGMVPGLGGVVAEWLGYGHAVQSAKDRSMFGKGDVRGVIAPEAATAAQKPGSILPTVAFGIPGNAAMAVLFGVFLIVGLRPGPEMLGERLDITYLMVWVVIVANIIAAVICLGLQRYLVMICYVRASIVGPVILSFMAVGAMLATRDFGDLLIFGIFGAVGCLFKYSDWPRVPLIIGTVLGPLAETYLFISAARYGASFLWERPIAMVLLSLIIVSILLPVYSRRQRGSALTVGGHE